MMNPPLITEINLENWLLEAKQETLAMIHKGLVQVPIIAICEQGHIQDFPWREWVYRSLVRDKK